MPKWKPCSSCDGLGFLTRQRIFKEDERVISELQKEKDCLVCFGKGEIYG